MVARTAIVCTIAALLVTACGGGDSFWLAVPLALLLAAPAASWHEGAAGAALVTLAASAPAMVSPGLGSQPSPFLIVAVMGTSVAIVIATRTRFEREREALRRSALTDPLTGAVNRRGLGERIEYEVARHARGKRKFAVVMIDLDGFKLVNDRFGHHAGDELLRDVAASLRDAVRDQDTVARMGGDEFCILAPETDHAGGDHLAERVNSAMRRVTTGLDTLSASVGVAVYPDDGTVPLEVLEAADDAQVAAKRARHGRTGRRAA